MVFILCATFLIAFRLTILRTSSVINNMMDNIYDNINIEYVKSVCEYTENTSEAIDFIPGLCNSLQSNKTKLWQYVATIALEWGAKYPGYNAILYNSYSNTRSTGESTGENAGENVETFVNYEKFSNQSKIELAKAELLTHVDENGVSYYNKILRAMVTYSLINYFMENNLKYEAQRFFSINNLLIGFYGKLFGVAKERENPFLYLKTNNLMLINYAFSYDKYSGIDKKVFDLLLNDYDDIKDNITNGIITAHDILNYKMTPSAYFHILIAIVGILIIFSRFLNFLNTSQPV